MTRIFFRKLCYIIVENDIYIYIYLSTSTLLFSNFNVQSTPIILNNNTFYIFFTAHQLISKIIHKL